MTRAIQDELGLNYDVMLEGDLDKKNEALNVTNKTKTSVYLWGMKKDSDWQKLYKTAKPMLPGSVTPIGVTLFVHELSRYDPQGPIEVMAIQLLLKNQQGEKFVGHFTLAINGKNGIGGVSATPIYVSRENWNVKESNASTAPSVNP